MEGMDDLPDLDHIGGGAGFGSGGPFDDAGVGAAGEADGGDRPQFSEAQTKALLDELTPQLREELCQVLRHQSDGKPEGDRPMMSAELARVLKRFQRRCGIGPDGKRIPDQGDEVWPMYLGIALFLIIACLFGFLWLQEHMIEQDLSNEEDFYWQVKEW
mmetsp:Transcript_124440/g.357525  ORF Transcript_124440/g.357525 Transcript_124440/m.357525 type:complete len:159 (-) Transcript_124440:147-623(-)